MCAQVLVREMHRDEPLLEFLNHVSPNTSGSSWRNAGLDVFSQSSRHEDDEEALKWTAL